MSDAGRNSPSTVLGPLSGLALVGAQMAGLFQPTTLPAQIVFSAVAIWCVFVSVHHAEVVAAKTGEPFGSIILAVAVTVIEVGLILSLMASAPDGGLNIARDTIYSAVMIVTGGIVGVCLVLGGSRHFEQSIRVQGTSSALAVLAALATITMILPNHTEARFGPAYSPAQLIVAATVSLVLYGGFIFAQTVRHRSAFVGEEDHDDEVPTPGHGQALASLALLVASLAAVIFLAKAMSTPIMETILHAGLPASFTGVIIATLVLLPEGIAAARAALANRMQKSLNLALGSALASIGLTIPVVAAYGLFNNLELHLGISPAKSVLLVLALFVSTLTLTNGKTTLLHGIVHLAVFSMYFLVAAVP